jgi:hypothetical protein
VNGNTWYPLNTLATTTTSYQSFTVGLSAAAAAAGVALSADTQIKFQRYHNVSGTAPSLGLAFDNVGVTVAATATTVSDVTSTTTNGTYGTGAVIPILVTFSGPVTVTGTPSLALNSGGTATYSGGSGTSTLTFTYTVSAGQQSSDLDYTTTAALTLNGGTITGAGSLAATLTLPAVGGTGSLGANKNIVIDAVAPTVLNYRVLFGTQSYDLIGSTRIRLPWTIQKVQVVFSEPITSATLGSLTGVPTTGVAGLGTTTLTWTLTPIDSGTFATTVLGTGADKVTDGAGNALAGGAGFAQAFKVLYGDFDDNGVVNSTDSANIYALTIGAYNLLADLNGDGVIDINDVKIARLRLGAAL